MKKLHKTAIFLCVGLVGCTNIQIKSWNKESPPYPSTKNPGHWIINRSLDENTAHFWVIQYQILGKPNIDLAKTRLERLGLKHRITCVEVLKIWRSEDKKIVAIGGQPCKNQRDTM